MNKDGDDKYNLRVIMYILETNLGVRALYIRDKMSWLMEFHNPKIEGENQWVRLVSQKYEYHASTMVIR